jgi:hypothetical protein
MKFWESIKIQLSDKLKTLTKKWLLNGILTNIRLTEDSPKENSKMYQKPLMFFQIITEDQLMIE